jgi:RNA polymerase sigma-70 factor (ECF subfamily)
MARAKIGARMLTTVTSETLLHGLRDPRNDTVWTSFTERYRPVVVGIARRAGLTAADAEDVAQQTLLAFAGAYREGKFDPRRGRLRHWLCGIARTTTRNWARQQRRPLAALDPEEPADGDRFAELWEEEWREAVLRQCLGEVRREVHETTFRAFVEFALEGRPAGEVARELGISENAVFGAKRRVMARIRELRPLMDEIW